MPLLKTIAKSPLVVTQSGIQLGYKQFSIATTMESIGFASLSSMPWFFSSTSRVNVKRKVSSLASIAPTWNSNVKVFVILVLY